jgi:cytochrome P450 family 9
MTFHHVAGKLSLTATPHLFLTQLQDVTMLESLWVWTLAIGLTLLITYLIGTWTHNHFSRRNVPSLKPLPFLGNMAPVVFRALSFPDFVVYLYNRLKGHKYGGTYQFMTPTLLLRDPELIKMVTVKDFEHFLDHQAPISEDVEPVFGKALFNLKGELLIAWTVLVLRLERMQNFL